MVFGFGFGDGRLAVAGVFCISLCCFFGGPRG
jgi:hypothetical protein